MGPSYHFGHLILEYMKRHSDTVGQIDAATGKDETYGSILSRSIRLARSLRAFGLKPGDVLAVSGRNHLDVRIPFYAGLFNGLPILGVDPYFKYDEILALFKQTKPKIVFCQKECSDIHKKVAVDLGLEIKIVTFDEGECTFSKFIEKYDVRQPDQDFKVLEFDIEKIYAFLICTSGTTGFVKVAAFQHRPFMMKVSGMLKRHAEVNLSGTRTLTLSPVQWITSYYVTIVSPLRGDTSIQTSIPDDFDHVIDIINKYKLVDPDPGKEINEPNVIGELWTKGPRFSVLPSEIEEVISKLPGVREVCVVGVPHELDGERPAACVVRDNNSAVTAQEIRDLVASKLSKNKELRGGVVFVDSLPRTSTGKVVIKKLLKQIENCTIE